MLDIGTNTVLMEGGLQSYHDWGPTHGSVAVM